MLPLLVSLSLSLTTAATATNLYATHYSGTVYALSLDESSDGYALSLAQELTACGPAPSWLTLDANKKVLYCSDETGWAGPPGSLSTLAIDETGQLEEVATTSAPGGGVHSVIYGDEGEYLAIAHYGGSALSTFRLPLQSNADDLLQAFHYNLTHEPPHPQQNAPHPHQVILDPTGGFILSPDLGTDEVRIYSIDKANGYLSPCPGINFTLGEGPRHGVFAPRALAVPASSSLRHRRQLGALPTTLYIATELGGHVYAFDVSYPATRSGCPTFRQTQKITPYPSALPEGASLSEIQQTLGEVYVTIRSDQAFPPNDSIATLDRGAVNGTLSFRELTSAYGTVPRTMVINPAGDLVAVGNQASSAVVIVKRDVNTGALGEEVASLQIGEPGEPGTATGLSSVVWGL